jgi:hypothetical protein
MMSIVYCVLQVCNFALMQVRPFSFSTIRAVIPIYHSNAEFSGHHECQPFKAKFVVTVQVSSYWRAVLSERHPLTGVDVKPVGVQISGVEELESVRVEHI